jgi:arsenate reductase
MKKYVLFVCTGNSARSQIAEGFFNHYNKNPNYQGLSAGTHPAESIKPQAVEVMKEKGIDLSKKKPKALTWKVAQDAYRIYTMGCSESCPVTPPEKTEDWKLYDPAGKPIEKFREVRDEIEVRVRKLISELEVNK